MLCISLSSGWVWRVGTLPFASAALHCLPLYRRRGRAGDSKPVERFMGLDGVRCGF